MTRSTTRISTPMMCSTQMMVMPMRLLMSPSRSAARSISARSSPPRLSSASSSRGLVASARASSSFFSAAAPSPLVVAADRSAGRPCRAPPRRGARASRARNLAGLAVIGRERDVLEQRQFAERPRDLEGAARRPARQIAMRRQARRSPCPRSGSSRQLGRSVPGDQVEGRALARAVRPDQAEDFARAHLKGHLVDGQESSEALA